MRVFLTAAATAGAAASGAAATLVGNRGAIIMAAAVLALVWVPVAISPLRTMQTLDGRA